MAPMLGIAGAIVAWLAQIPDTRAGRGFLPDMALALFGSALMGSLVAGAANITMTFQIGMFAMVTVGMLGAALAILVQRTVWPSHP
jgi:uncharacterized membrane protein YeaQ/YmgE (transglycosylase-associated protein family)